MASKNNPQALLDEGFAPEQFGKDSSTWGAYVQPLLDEQSLLVQGRVGTTTYALDNTTPTGLNVELAERYLACAILCSRRINRLEAALAQSRQSDQMTSLITELRNNQRNYSRMAEETLAALSAAPLSESSLSSPAFGATISSHFPVAVQ